MASKAIAAVLMWAVSSGLVEAQAAHVAFLVMGKTTNHRQAVSGQLSLLNYHFFAEIFPKPGAGQVTEASLRFPDGHRQGFEDLGYVLEVHGGRYDDEAELDELYPNGDYSFAFTTPSGRVDPRVLSVRGTGKGKSRIPPPARITLAQEGRVVSPDAIDANEDLTVTWTPFRTGSKDPNGIVDDLVFVVVADCHGEKIEHSGRPFEGTPFLTFEATEYVIPSVKLVPGRPYQMSIEHAKVDTSKEDGIVGLVTYASTTFLDFRTAGVGDGASGCPDVMPKFDAGQTDRSGR
jgi:hypothetical protein